MCALEKLNVIFQLISGQQSTRSNSVVHTLIRRFQSFYYYISLFRHAAADAAAVHIPNHPCTIYSNPLKMCRQLFMCKRQTIPFYCSRFCFTFQFRFLHVTDKNRFCFSFSWKYVHAFGMNGEK